MDIRKIKKLIELVEESGIAELEISEGEESVRISRHGVAPVAPIHYAAPAPIAAPAPVAAPAAAPAAEAPAASKTPAGHMFFLQWLVLSTALQVQIQKRSSKWAKL